MGTNDIFEKNNRSPSRDSSGRICLPWEKIQKFEFHLKWYTSCQREKVLLKKLYIDKLI